MSSLVLIKPDAFERKLQGDITHELHQIGTVCQMRLVPSVSAEKLKRHYEGKFLCQSLIDEMTGGQVLAIQMYGDCLNIRAACHKIRAKYLPQGYDGPRNLIHSSDSEEAAEREISIWFDPWDALVAAVLPVGRVFDFPIENLNTQ